MDVAKGCGWRDISRFYAAYTDSRFLPQPAAEIGSPALDAETLSEVPWGHHLLLLDKVSDSESRQYYLRATVRYGWTRNVLLNQIKAAAYERSLKEGKAHNFNLALRAEKDDVVVEFSLKSKTNPIGVAEYQRTDRLPKDLKGKSPSEKALRNILLIQSPKNKRKKGT